MKVRVFRVPYDSGYKARRMGLGPDAIAPALAESLRGDEIETCMELVESDRDFPTENGVGFELMRKLAPRVRDANEAGEIPIVLSGNCGVAVGTIAGLGATYTGVLWLDAHGELNTPETTRSGFLDGMGLAIATGRCWRAATREIPGFAPLADAHLVMVGTRDLDPAERDLFDESRIAVIPPEDARGDAATHLLVPALDRLAERVRRLYVHLDVDVLDPAIAPSNGYAASGGLSVEEVERVFTLARDRFEIAAVGVGSYDPGMDEERKTPSVVTRLVRVAIGGRQSE